MSDKAEQDKAKQGKRGRKANVEKLVPPVGVSFASIKDLYKKTVILIDNEDEGQDLQAEQAGGSNFEKQHDTLEDTRESEDTPLQLPKVS